MTHRTLNVAEKIASYQFLKKELAIKYSTQENQKQISSLKNGIIISIEIIKKLEFEISKLNKDNKNLYKKIQHLSTTVPHVGAAVSLGTSYILKSPDIALASGSFLIGAGPVLSVILHLRKEAQIKDLMKKIDNYLLKTIKYHSWKKNISFQELETDQILEVWNFLRRPDFTSLIKRIEILRNLNLDNPSLAALVISSFVLLEKSGMVEKEKILEIGINRILHILERTHDELFELFTISTLNLLYQQEKSKKTIETILPQSTYLSSEQKTLILLKPENFINHLSKNKYEKLLIAWYKLVLVTEKNLKIDEF